MNAQQPRAVRPAGLWAGAPGYHKEVLRNPWYRLLGELQNSFNELTVEFWRARGGQTLHLPITTGAVSSPLGLGSDSVPVGVDLGGAPTFLADSMQFMLEMGCRISRRACYYIMPSFRGEPSDETHLSQFFHSEAEIFGDLAHVMRHVEDYLSYLAEQLLARHHSAVVDAAGDISHILALIGADSFPSITFDEATELLDEGDIVDHGSWRTITRAGEQRLMQRVGSPLWLTHWDHLAVPFYQAFSQTGRSLNADLLLGPGEIVGCGERHIKAQDVRRALALHKVDPVPYEWYVDMREVDELQTSGFGLGVERFFMWMLRHDDIRDMQLVPREMGKQITP